MGLYEPTWSYKTLEKKTLEKKNDLEKKRQLNVYNILNDKIVL
jgi:hypothetical protein